MDMMEDIMIMMKVETLYVDLVSTKFEFSIPWRK